MKRNEAIVRMFVNGQAMGGGSINFALQGATFLGAIRTAPCYRFYSVRDEFPGLYPATAGERIIGEIYELSYAQLREELLPNEPEELELTVIKLEDGTGTLSMRIREAALGDPGVVDITRYGGWLKYLESLNPSQGK